MELIVGGESTIGAALSNFWTEKNIPFRASTRNTELLLNSRLFIDLSQPHTFSDISGYKSAVICAAITEMSVCENNPIETKSVNVSGTIELIKRLSSINTYVLFLSTNQVFDGKHPNRKPDASRNPISEYGRQKAEVEIFIGSIPNAGVLRLSKVILPDLELLIKWK